ncbi:MAG TPA: TonB-dependent receptor, partial [Polyangiaceae bacterium]|nr:TonB-dependent receptor [Polyangiaceae bacterium]
RVFGAYLQQTWQPAKGFALNAGARLDYDQRYGYQVSPRVAIAVGAWRDATLKAVYSEAFRAPSWAESNRAVGTQLPANDLRAETVRSFETSVEQKLGAHRLLFGVFASMWSDLVELKVLNPDELQQAKDAGAASFGTRTASQFRNISALRNVGWNAGYDGSTAAETLRSALNVTSSVTRDDHDGVEHPIAVAPSMFGNARISYALPDAWPTLGVAGYYFSRRPADRAFDGVFAARPYAPPQVELRTSVTGKVPFLPHLTYRGSANYAFAAQGPYVIGPNQGSSSKIVTAELIPVDKFRASIGVQYDF